MLELQKRQIHMSRSKGSIISQIIFDEDFIVPDTRTDVGSILLKQANAEAEELRVLQEKVMIRGKLEFEMLYSAEDGGSMQNLTGSLEFDESVSYPGLETRDSVRCRARVEDLSVRIINSRKLHINAVAILELTAFSEIIQEAAGGIKSDMKLEMRGCDTEAAVLRVQKKDTFHMSETFELPSGKPDVRHLLWKNISLREISYRLESDQLDIQAEALVFFIYQAEQEQAPVQWMEKNIRFQGKISLTGCEASMIPAIEAVIGSRSIEAAADENGEERRINAEAVIELDIRLYQEEKIHLLCDAYSPERTLITEYEKAHFEKLLMKNQAKCRLTEHITLHTRDTMLQICHCQARTAIDRTEIVPEGIRAEGALSFTILYLAANDEKPMQSLAGVIPIAHVIEAGGIEQGSFFDICPMIEQINAMVIPGGEIEIRAVVSFDTLVLSEKDISVLAKAVPAEKEDIEQCPGMIGYIVKEGDTLWSIAKKYRMSIEQIRSVNEIKGEDPGKGERLLLVRQ